MPVRSVCHAMIIFIKSPLIEVNCLSDIENISSVERERAMPAFFFSAGDRQFSKESSEHIADLVMLHDDGADQWLR